jgi:tetratricopeptide (TPR) repeat protein
MIENISTQNQEISVPESKVCLNCGNPEIFKDSPNPLCSECREKFIKFPIPLWVKAFGGVVAALVIFSLFSMPANISRGITYEKGIKAENEKNYLTAQHYFRTVVNNTPGYIEAKAHLLITSFYNNDLYTFTAMSDTLTGKSVDDNYLLNKVQELLDKAVNYFPTDSFIAMHEKYKDVADTIPDSVYEELIKNNSKDVFSKVMYASSLYNRNAYAKADSVLADILTEDSEHISALEMMAAIKRLENHPEQSLEYCEKLLQVNHESIYGLSCKARTLLKMNKNTEALKLALQSTQLDSTDYYSKATLALAYHFNNKTAERDKIIHNATATKDSAVMTYFQFVLDVISNKETL